ncbi:MAG: hypothetical protein ACRC8Y_27080 [Chroococcales cyanobacterium]
MAYSFLKTYYNRIPCDYFDSRLCFILHDGGKPGGSTAENTDCCGDRIRYFIKSFNRRVIGPIAIVSPKKEADKPNRDRSSIAGNRD